MVHIPAWIPFIEPMPTLGSWWPILLIPLAIGISMIYKAIRLPTLRNYAISVGIMTTQIVIAMVLLAIALYLLVQVIIPNIPAD